MVLGIQSPSSADSWHCTQYGAGQACIHELLGGSPGGSIIFARFYNNAGKGNYASAQLWATDLNWSVGANPSVGEAWVPLGNTLDYGSNFLPLGQGTCHTYAAKIVLRSGTVLWSPKEKYCYNDTTRR